MESVAVLFLTLTGLAANAPAHWDMAILNKAPQTYSAPAFGIDEKATGGPEHCFTGEGVRPLFYDGLPWEGKATRVFAWYGCPPHEEREKVPAMVLVHGGGGTAFDEWVRIWNQRGYAAISMDVTGSRPGGKPGGRPRHEWGGPGHEDFDADIDKPIQDQWIYHAVADVVLAHSLLRSMPEIDSERIGLTGISWGGFLTCITSAVDSRFQFAIPVYGCGFHDRGPALNKMWGKMGEDRAKKWFELWDPSQYLPHTKIPMLWVDDASDFFAPLHIYTPSYALVKSPKMLSVHIGLGHSHVRGWISDEIYAYADSHLKGVPSLPEFTVESRSGKMVSATFEAETAPKEAFLACASDISDWTKCEWTKHPAQLDAEKGRVQAEVPEGCRAYFFILADERDLQVTTPRVVLPEEEGKP